MLSHLSITNYVLIEKLNIDFQSGFSTITGETGAGKSILLGALGLILGDRADKEVVIENAKKCIIEGSFNVEKLNLEPFFRLHDIDYDTHCILRREVTSLGKSRAFVNDTPVKLPLLKELGLFLVDVHSQNQNAQLNNSLYRINILDAYANHSGLLNKYRADYKIYKEQVESLDLLKAKYAQQLNEQEYHQFLFDELDKANINAGEQNELEEELQVLNHAEEINQNIYFSSQELLNKDENVVSKLELIIDSLRKISSYHQPISDIEKRLHSLYIELKDIGDEVYNMEDHFHFDPTRLEFVNARLSSFYTLLKKHSFNNSDELITYKQNLLEKINSVEDSEEEIKQLENSILILLGKLEEQAKRITKNRKKSSLSIAKLVLNNLHELGMEKADLEVQFEQLDELSVHGKDKINFLFKANKGGKLAEISKVASGGEMSRIMLSFKYAMALKQALPTIIFDEIDTGVSGEIADKLANLMKSLGQSLQVLSITHLPQIASKADHHYLVYKENESTFTRSNMKKLNHEERTTQIAAMLSGSNIGDSAIEHAKELLGS